MEEKEYLLLQIEKNPNIINNWKIDTLLKLKRVCENQIKQNNEKIKSLKKK